MKILVVSAHPDDEVIGAGGTLLKHAKQGDAIFWLIMTTMNGHGSYSPEQITQRENEIQKVAKRLSIKKVFQLQHITTRLDQVHLSNIISDVSGIMKEVEPEVVYLPNRSDVHTDHQVTFNAVFACTKSFRYPSVKRVLMYECLSETEFAPTTSDQSFLPNWLVDISPFYQGKLELLQVYSSEMGQHPFPRSLRNAESLAVFRGAMAGVEYAEAFQLIKLIEK
jgi:LmbE family N-acetylglucosaminyl deacetylase